MWSTFKGAEPTGSKSDSNTLFMSPTLAVQVLRNHQHIYMYCTQTNIHIDIRARKYQGGGGLPKGSFWLHLTVEKAKIQYCVLYNVRMYTVLSVLCCPEHGCAPCLEHGCAPCPELCCAPCPDHCYASFLKISCAPYSEHTSVLQNLNTAVLRFVNSTVLRGLSTTVLHFLNPLCSVP